MSSQLQTSIYRGHRSLSNRRTEVTPLTHLQVLHIYTRFQIGRSTAEDQRDFWYWKGMSVGQFITINNIQLVEAVLE